MEHNSVTVKERMAKALDDSHIRDMFGTSISGCHAGAKAFGPYGGSDTRLSDREIRCALRALIPFSGWLASDLMVEEVECWRGYVRADYLCVHDDLAVIEIKSDRDTLSRFDEQVRVYSAIADRVTLIVGWRLAASALRKTPSWWQVMLVERNSDSEARFIPLRDGGKNPAVDSAAVVRMLPISDVRRLAGMIGVSDRTRARHLREQVARDAPADALREAVHNWLARVSNQRETVSE